MTNATFERNRFKLG